MWLWKKFWNTDIIGKIYILIILFIVVVATITVVTRYKNASTNQVVNDEQNENIQDAELIEQNTTIDDTITMAEVEVENIKQEDIKTNIEIKEQEKSTISIDNKNTTNIKEDSKEKVISNNNTNQAVYENENKKDKQIIPEEQVQELEEIEIEDNKQEEIDKKEDTTSQEIIREVKRNGDYIQKIYDYIIANDKSEYSIEEDSSIVNEEDGFSFSSFNMDSYIGNYSVYRIYAQDYYINGVYIETRCYIG